jgi:flagellar motor switch protein FliM
MEPDWIKLDFRNAGQRRDVTDDRMLIAQETLARDLSINLSAFLRSSITVAYQGGAEAAFGELVKDGSRSSFGLALLRPDDWKLLLRAEHSVLFPLIGIALGAKAGSFTTPDRKPTDIELQVVTLLFRLILSETYRAWSPVLKRPLETITLEIEQTPTRTFQASDSVFVARFELTLAEYSGKLSLILPASLMAAALMEEKTDQQRPKEVVSSANTIEQMMTAKVSLDVWLEGSEMRLGDLLQLREGQVVKLDHPVDRKVGCTLNGAPSSNGQIVSTGTRRAFLLDDSLTLGVPRP